MTTIVCPHCGDVTQQDIVLPSFTCGACDQPFTPPQTTVEPIPQDDLTRAQVAAIITMRDGELIVPSSTQPTAPGASTGNEPAQLAAEAAARKGALDDPEFLLWHFAMNSRQRDMQITIHYEMWLQYARTLRALLRERDVRQGAT
jgi:hypothetical protein